MTNFSGLLRCGDHYTSRGSGRWVCSFHKNRGPSVCGNGRVVRREVLERQLLRAIEREIMAPDAVAHLTRKVNDAPARASARGTSGRRALEAQLRRAEREAENIKEAVRHGRAMATLLTMLEEVEDKIQCVRAELNGEPKVQAAIRVLPALVKK